jgi:hypothetical protein
MYTKKACGVVTPQAFVHSPEGKRISVFSLEQVRQQEQQQEQQLLRQQQEQQLCWTKVLPEQASVLQQQEQEQEQELLLFSCSQLRKQ